MKLTMLAIGVMLAVISACLLGVVVLAGQGDLLNPDVAWLEPYVGSGGGVAAGIGAGDSRRDDRHRPGTLGPSQAGTHQHRTPARRPAGLGVR